MPNDTVPGEKDWVYGVKLAGRVLGQREKVPQGAYLTIVVGDGRSHTEIQVDTAGIAVQTPAPEMEETGAADESWF